MNAKHRPSTWPFSQTSVLRSGTGTAVALSLAALLSSQPAAAQCTSNDDCRGERICDGGQCTDAAAVHQSCTKDVDCPSDHICDKNVCTATAGAQQTPAPETPAPATPTPPSAPPAGPTETPAAGQPGGPQTPTAVGGVRDTCRATQDCATGLRCIDKVCTSDKEGAPCGATADCGSHLVCRAEQCLPPGTEPPGLWDGSNMFIGAVVGIGPAFVMNTGMKDYVDGTFLGAVRVGAWLGNFEATIELAPVTWMTYFDYPDPVLSMTTTVGGIIELTDHLYWPMRFRAGLVAVNVPNDDVFTVLGWDLVGLGYRLDSGWAFEANLPSYRYVGDFDNANVFTWPMTFSASYVL